MDYKMHISHLTKDMLLNELSARGLNPGENKTVVELRAALRPLLKMEQRGALPNPVIATFDFDQEKAVVSALLVELTNSFKDIKGPKAGPRFVRVQSRLSHLLKRVSRLSVTNLSEEQTSSRSSLMLDILTALGQLDNLLAIDPNLSASLGKDQESGDELDSNGSDNGGGEFDVEQPHFNGAQSTSSQLVPLTRSPSNSVKVERIVKWGLKFSGNVRQLSVHNFLERVSELRKARGVTTLDLFQSAIDLFEGKALNWFRANCTRFNDWDSLSSLLVKHFEPPDYRPRLFKEILERTQDPSESIIDYLSCMSALFRRYGGMTAEMQLDIVSRNLSPFYTTQLPVVRTLEELEDECLKLEAKKYRADHFVPPARKRHGFVEPDFAFVSVDVPVTVGRPVHEVSVVPSPKSAGCWNCGEQGHLSRQCTLPKTLHCYRCGAREVTSRRCPKCNPTQPVSTSGNETRERH